MKQGWTYKKLGELGTIVTGSTPSTKIKEYYCSNDYCFIKPSDLPAEGYQIIVESENYISSKGYEVSRKLPKGSVLVSCIGIIGKTAILGMDACTNQQINAIIPNEYVNNKFLAYSILSQRYVLSSVANAPVVPLINKSDFSKVEIPLPPLSVQLSIVSELDKINELIRLKKEQLKDYDNLAQSIFYEMFGDPVVNEKGWEVKKLGDVCKFTQGTQVPIEEQHLSKENGLVQFLRIIDFTQGKDAPRFVKCSNDKYILHEREIAIVRYGTPGFVCYGKIGAIANNLFKITPNQKDMFEFEFLVHWLNTEAFQSAVKSKQYGAALQAIKFSTIQGINIIIPSLTVQRSFATRISQIDKQKQYIEESIKELESLLASRMQYWFD